MRTRLSLLLVVAALLALAAACDDAGDGDAAQDIAVIELRVWQSAGNPEELHATPRLTGSDWGGTVSLEKDGRSAGFADAAVHHYSDIVVAGVGLRIWQRAIEPERIFVQACASTCSERFPIKVSVFWPWRPLGMAPLSLDDGSSPDGRYRYGNLAIAVPRGNPELLEERERLLALRDVFEGGGTELDWSVATPTASWEGVTVSGLPPRVTRLELSDRGLNGEIWGYLGDLAELTELRLDGNALTGTIPSKLVLLNKLTGLHLAGNRLENCLPPPLRAVPDNDLDSLGLPECADPAFGVQDRISPAGTYHFILNKIFGASIHEGWRPLHVVLDVPGGKLMQFEFFEPVLGADELPLPTDNIFAADVLGLALRDSRSPETWLFLDEKTGEELERSPYSGCVYDCGPGGSNAALVEQLTASVWLNPAIPGDGRERPAIDATSKTYIWPWAWP